VGARKEVSRLSPLAKAIVATRVVVGAARCRDRATAQKENAPTKVEAFR